MLPRRLWLGRRLGRQQHHQYQQQLQHPVQLQQRPGWKPQQHQTAATTSTAEIATSRLGNSSWQHNPEHRRSVPYGNKDTAQRFDGSTRDSAGTHGLDVRRQGDVRAIADQTRIDRWTAVPTAGSPGIAPAAPGPRRQPQRGQRQPLRTARWAAAVPVADPGRERPRLLQLPAKQRRVERARSSGGACAEFRRRVTGRRRRPPPVEED